MSDPHFSESDKENSNVVQKLNCNEVDKIHEFNQGFEKGSMMILDITELAEILKLESFLMKYKVLLAEQSPAAKLWLQYIEYIETVLNCCSHQNAELVCCNWSY